MRNMLCAIQILLVGCAANRANYSHFPQVDQIDFQKIDTLQRVDAAPGRSGYNCNPANDYLIKVKGIDSTELRSRISDSYKNNGFSLKDTATPGLILGERGFRSFEYKTLVGTYFKAFDTLTYLYVKTEITQDATCGPERDRAKPLVDDLCNSIGRCVEAKEVAATSTAKIGGSKTSAPSQESVPPAPEIRKDPGFPAALSVRKSFNNPGRIARRPYRREFYLTSDTTFVSGLPGMFQSSLLMDLHGFVWVN